MRVLRVYHAGRDAAHRARERALVAAGVDVTLVVPASWPEAGAQRELSPEPFPVVELDVRRPGDVNRHAYADPDALARTVAAARPDVLDLHEEPVSVAARQWLRAAGALPVVMYTAQNIDKRFPPPFAQSERAALRRVDALYPCSRQAAAVARGKGFAGRVEVLPLGVDRSVTPGDQRADDAEVVLALVGRLVPEKGVRDAVRVLARLRARRAARLLVVGEGPERGPAEALAAELGVADALEVLPWQPADRLAQLYREVHVVLVPSRATATWVEQFGRIVPEAQGAGAVVAAYASGAIPEVCGGAGALVPEGDVDALGRTVTGLLADPARFAALRSAGLARAAAARWPVVAARQAALYEQAAATRGARPGVPGPAAVRRGLAEREFGPVAVLAGGLRRPFAAPVLRTDNRWTRGLGRALDGAAGLLHR